MIFCVTSKKWADDQFGGVRSAFSVFDDDGSNEVTYKEFRQACKIYGFYGDVLLLFRALDAESNGSLSMSEVAFLDDWEMPDEESLEEDD